MTLGFAVVCLSASTKIKKAPSLRHVSMHSLAELWKHPAQGQG